MSAELTSTQPSPTGTSTAITCFSLPAVFKFLQEAGDQTRRSVRRGHPRDGNPGRIVDVEPDGRRDPSLSRTRNRSAS